MKIFQKNLSLLTLQHVHVGTIRDSENVGWDFITSLALVDLYSSVGVNGVTLVWVDGDAEEARVGVNELVDVTDLQVVKYGWIVEVCQVGHVLAFLELGWVDLVDLVFLVVPGFTTWDTNGDEVTLGSLDLTEKETFLFIGDPARFLSIVRFCLIDSLLFERDEQVLGWIGIWTRGLDNVARHGGLSAIEFSSQTHKNARTALELS